MSSDPPLIAHVIYRFGVGGLENGVVNLINHLPAKKYRHAVICATDYTDFAKRIQRGDVQVYALHKRPGNDFDAQCRLWKLLRQIKPQIVHTRNFGTIEYSIPAFLAGVPHRVHGEHGRDMLDIDGSKQKYKLLRKCYSPFINCFVTMSQDLQQWLQNDVGIGSEKIVQLYNGVDFSRFSSTANPALRQEIGLPTECFSIGSVGRLQKEKDQRTLIEAFNLLVNQVAPQGRELRLVLAGDGPEKNDLKTLVNQYNLTDKVLFLGARNDVPQIMALLDLFVLPSLGEGISNTILEAMASGLPVVATDVGGNPELVVDGKTGYLVPSQAPKQIVQVISDYLSTPKKLGQHGKQGQQRARRLFSLETMVTRYTAFYDDLL